MKPVSDKSVIVDSRLSLGFVLQNRQSPEMPAPELILVRQRIATVRYYCFDGLLHEGQVVADLELINEIVAAFDIIRSSQFPLRSAIPFVDRTKMDAAANIDSLNNSSAYNFRNVRDGTALSQHAYGRAIDINPFFNPMILADKVKPKNAAYDPSRPGTILGSELFVLHLKSLGWIWGGDWTDCKDYMHFEKPKNSKKSRNRE